MKGCEEWGLSGGMVAAQAAPKVLGAQQEAVAAVSRRRMALLLDDEVVAGSPVAKKAAVDMAVLLRRILEADACAIIDIHTLLRVWAVISLRVLLRWGGLGWVASISLIMTTILVGRLSLRH